MEFSARPACRLHLTGMDLTPGKLPEAAVSLLAWTFGDEDRAMARNDSCKDGNRGGVHAASDFRPQTRP
jgi:hypothetical protein